MGSKKRAALPKFLPPALAWHSNKKKRQQIDTAPVHARSPSLSLAAGAGRTPVRVS
jgi:hypothetical protein